MGIDVFRQKIDQIDKQVLALLNERMELAGKIGEAKRAEGGPVYVPAREEKLVQKLLAANKGPMGEVQVRSIFREVISAGISLQKKMLIGFCGSDAGEAHLAALKNFGSSLDYKGYAHMADLFGAVTRREVDFGVVPVENSLDGTVFETLDELSKSTLKIASQIILPVEHCLISSDALKDITCIYAEERVFDQCHHWLDEHMPEVECIVVGRGDQGATVAKDNPGVAVIGSRLLAHLFELPILEEAIQDNKENKTRFFIVGHDAQLPSADVSWKSSLYLTLPNTPGALHKALQPFASRGIDLTKMETRPSQKRIWDYVFYIDFLGHWEDELVRDATQELESEGAFVKWLGSYPRIKTTE